MRSRTTWKDKGPETATRTAATLRTADPYTMNQDHPNPGPTDYAISGHDKPADWAEEVTSYDSVADEYEGEHVKRNELGFGEFRKDTWKHKDSDQWGGKGKYDNKTASERKAQAALKLATLVLRSGDSPTARKVATGLMALPDAVLAQTVKAAAASAPEALPHESRFKRALACTKLAARLLGDGSDEPTVEKLARAFYRIDDPTLKSIVRTVATARLAQEQDVKDDSKDSPVAAKKDAPEDDVLPEVQASAEDDAADDQGLTAEEKAMAQEMLSDGGDDLSALFTMAPPVPVQPGVVPAAPVAPMGAVPCVPAMAGESPSITFGDDDDAHVASDGMSIDDIFADDPEVQAQREIQAAHREASARASAGFDVRTASAKTTGAKKLGAVTRTASAAPVADPLENIWR